MISPKLHEAEYLKRDWRRLTPWLIVTLLAFGGFVVPITHPFGIKSSGISGAWGGALIAAGATLAGVLIAAGQTRRDAAIEARRRRHSVNALVVAEISVIADRLITMKPIIDSLMKEADHKQPVLLGNIRQRYIGSMPITRSISSDLALLPQNHVAAITCFLTELDLFLSDFAQFSVPSGELSYWTALFLQTRLDKMCEQLGGLFEIIAPGESTKNPTMAETPISTILHNMSKRIHDF